MAISGKGLPSKFARKPYLHDENRRATYNITEEPVIQPDTIFSTFEGEARQLVAVCNHDSLSLFWSLAHVDV